MKQAYSVMYNRQWKYDNHERYNKSNKKRNHQMTWLKNGIIFGNNDEVYYKWIETKRSMTKWW